MAKLLLIVLIGVVVYALWKKSQSNARPAASGRANAPPEAMMQCARCGVHFPAGEAVMRDGKSYCSAGHAQAAPD